MNFTTDLPKRNPLVSYIVASAVRCEKFFAPSSRPGPVYRMHAVILKLKPGQQLGVVPNNPFNQELSTRKPLYICCHVRRVEAVENEIHVSEEDDALFQKPAVKQQPLGG
jgi:hypothetical protein